MDANDEELNAAYLQDANLNGVEPSHNIDDKQSTFFDNSDEVQAQINAKTREMQMKAAMELRAKFLKNQNAHDLLSTAGYPAASIIDGANLNAHQLEMQKMLLNPDMEFYHKTDDRVYEKFRQTIRDREAFNNEVKQIKLTDEIKIWRTNKRIEDDCKQAMQRAREAEEAKRERIEYYVYCGCFRKKKQKLTNAQREERKKSLWASRVKKKRTDNHYKKATKQGWQGEPEPYSAIQIEMPNQEKGLNEKGMWYQLYYYFQTLLALFIFLFVADKIMNWFQPGYL